MISSQRIPPVGILCIFIGVIQQVCPLEREGVNEESKWHNRKEGMWSKKARPSHKFFYVLFFVTESLLLLGFSWSTDNITASNKKNTSKKEPPSVSEITIYLHKNIVIPLLCQWGLFIHKFVSKNSILFKDMIFYLLWYNVIR